MSEIIDEETAAKIITHIRQSDQDSPHFRATMINFVWSLHRTEGGLDDIELDDDEVEEILAEMPTDPERELAFLK
jgi:hypothetical protein